MIVAHGILNVYVVIVVVNINCEGIVGNRIIMMYHTCYLLGISICRGYIKACIASLQGDPFLLV